MTASASGGAPVVGRLVLYAFRRCFGLPWIATTLVAAGLARIALAARDDLAAAGLVDAQAGEALQRHGAWCALLACLVPFLAWSAARDAAKLARDERELLLGGGAEPWRVLLSMWCGHALAAAATFTLLLVVVEAQAGRGAPWPRTLGPAEAAHNRWAAAEGVEWSFATPPPDGTVALRVPLGLGSGAGAVAEAELVLAARDGRTTSTRARIGLQGEIVASLPDAAPAKAVVRTTDPAARVWLLDGATFEGAAEPAAAASVELALRGLCATLALLGLAFGLGLWMRPTLAFLLALVLWCAVAWSFDPEWLAGARLGSALLEVRAGRVPVALEAWDLADALALAAAGLALGLRALRGGGAGA